MPMNKQLTTILKNVKDTGLLAELMGRRDIKMTIRYSPRQGYIG
jgi:hypothetical protein